MKPLYNACFSCIGACNFVSSTSSSAPQPVAGHILSVAQGHRDTNSVYSRARINGLEPNNLLL